MLTRTIPSSGEQIPVIGMGTWKSFDVGKSEPERKALREVLNVMLQSGGKLIDTSPMYGNAEQVIGDLTSQPDITDRFFYATKVWTTGEANGVAQMRASMNKMYRKTIDLMQVHNLVDYSTHLKTLRKWKEEGIARYIGITHYSESYHGRLEQLIKTENIDFVQFNYSIRVRNAGKSLLPSASDHGVAVIINEPLERGSLLQAAGKNEIPEFCSDYDIKSWAQFFLKYIISHPAVTCVIPATSSPAHLADNMQAGYGRLPDERIRNKMIEAIRHL